MNIEINRIFLI